jgi:hypothetical protein
MFQVISNVHSILYGQVVYFNGFILKFASVSPDTCCEYRSSLDFFFNFLGHIQGPAEIPDDLATQL